MEDTHYYSYATMYVLQILTLEEPRQISPSEILQLPFIQAFLWLKLDSS